MNTFLRWAGSKRKLLPVLLAAAPAKFERYVEPFAGSACLFFALEPEKAVLGDINDDLVNTYRTLTTSVESVISHLKRFKCSKSEYYRIRAQPFSRMSKQRQAARFIYLNRFCFNGLYRTNMQGQFNVPYGGYKAGAVPSADLLRSCAASLGRASVVSGSFDRTLRKVRAGDFVYLDPPYSIESRRVFNEYSHFSFGSTELQCLRQHLLRLDKIKVPFLVSYGISREAHELARGFDRQEIVVQRQIAGFAAQRRKSRELLITNY
jgi:DNA adenine methylase